ncbi:MAG: hypothetical protein JWP52_2647 [Rhizobacter sp.]|nr:hypothetical protein [Rhizobacter sp.]
MFKAIRNPFRRAGSPPRADRGVPPASQATNRPRDWVLVPGTSEQIEAVADDCRRLVTRNALMAAGVAAVPVPGLDWVTDVGMLVKLIPQINERFGLTPEQVERLAPERRLAVYKAISAGGGLLVGKMVTRELVLRLLRLVGVRLTTQQVAKYVPIAGQAVSAALTFSALKIVCEQHIKQCMDVSRQLMLPAPGTPVEPLV